MPAKRDTTLPSPRINLAHAKRQVAGSYVFTSGDLVSSPMVRRVVQNMMNATLRKLEVRPAVRLVVGICEGGGWGACSVVQSYTGR